MPWGMPWRGLEPYGLVDHMLHIDQVDQAGLENRAHGVGHDDLRPAILALRPVLPFRTGYQIACPRKRRHPLPFDPSGVPANMIRMQMSADDGINTLRRIPRLSELRKEWPLPLVPRGNAPFLVIPNARVHNHPLLGDLQHQRMYTAHCITIGGQKRGQPRDAGQVVERRLWYDEPHAWRFKFLDTSDAHCPHLPA